MLTNANSMWMFLCKRMFLFLFSVPLPVCVDANENAGKILLTDSPTTDNEFSIYGDEEDRGKTMQLHFHSDYLHSHVSCLVSCCVSFSIFIFWKQNTGVEVGRSLIDLPLIPHSHHTLALPALGLRCYSAMVHHHHTCVWYPLPN